MKHLYIIAWLLSCPLMCVAQAEQKGAADATHSIKAPSRADMGRIVIDEAIVQSILLHNTTLKAEADEMRAQQLDNLTGLTLADPEVEFNYFWGSPHDIGNRTDLSVTQHFDYATLFGLKRKLAHNQNEVLNLQLQLRRLAIENEARQLLLDFSTLECRITLQHERIATAQQLANKYKKAMEQGETTRLERDKAQLALLAQQDELDELNTQRQKVMNQLKAMNGGNDIVQLANHDAHPQPLAYQQKTKDAQEATPQKNTLETIPQEGGQEAILSSLLSAQSRALEQETRNARAAALPELTVGYVSELTASEKFRGMTIGLSVPLWSNRGNVRRARAHEEAQRSLAEDAQLQLALQRQTLQEEMESHRARHERLCQALKAQTTQATLQRALQLGEISLLEYLQESSLLYDLQDKALQAEHDYLSAKESLRML